MKNFLFALVALLFVRLDTASVGQSNIESPPSTIDVTQTKQPAPSKRDTTDSCDDSDEFSETQNGINVAQTVNYHNELRRGEGSSDMQLVNWDGKLSDLAKELVERCLFEHSTSSEYGKNMYYATSNEFQQDAGVRSWFDEKKYYAYDTSTCTSGKACGHYTQVVWATSTRVGCAVKKCDKLADNGGPLADRAWFFACNYTPAGNMQGSKPFKKGKACTQCMNSKNQCEDGLCNGFCKDCMACEDTHPKCGGNPGWPSSWCTKKYQYVLDSCPKLCGLC